VKRLAAFTLVELLVVMAIIAILAGLLLPALASARERGRKATCASNLGQIGKSLAMYLTGYDEYYPSYANYGADSPAVDPYFKDSPRKVQEYQTRANSPRLASRNMVLAYSSGRDASKLTHDPANPRPNFIANGLGIMVKKKHLPDGGVLMCPSLGGKTLTYYGAGSTVEGYEHRSDLWKLLRGRSHTQGIEQGDGTWLKEHAGSEEAVALLGSFSYRLQPWVFGSYDSGTDTWTAAGAGDRRTVENTRPRVRAYYLCPPFKSRKQLGLRAVASDSFDHGKSKWTKGFAASHHTTGYNVLYGDSHVSWYYDGKETIVKWTWSGTLNRHIYNDLTISGPESQEVWHVFDQAADVDAD